LTGPVASFSAGPVLIAGGGPVGLITALALARQGLPVHVFEAESKINDSPRAATTHAATLEMLDDLGMVEEVIRHGLVEPLFRIWDRSNGKLVAEFDFGQLKNDTRYPFAVQYEQHKLANLAIEKLRALRHATLEFSARVTSLSQSANGVEITVETAAGRRVVKGCYLIGADGGRSTVRKSLGIAFDGYTHPERFLILTTPFDIGSRFPGCTRNYLSDPDDWCALFKVSGDDGTGLWRVLSSTRLDQTEAELFDDQAIEQRLQKFIPKEGRYTVVHRNLYHIHQRVAASFRQGRVFLVGDAAHVNNPLGGLGLNFGIHDAIELSGLLGRVLRHQAPVDTLDLYDRHRRPLNIEFVQQQTIANKRRMEEKDPVARKKHFEELAATAADPLAHRAYLLRASLIDSVRQRAAP
jgi:2-polyprenyl-6-methoxyphenol hydroxylase-like FAD-dependent oxidoreductase